MIVEFGAALLIVSFGASFGLYALGSGTTTLTLPHRGTVGSISRRVRDRLTITPASADQSPNAEAEASPDERLGSAVIWASILWRPSRATDPGPDRVSVIAHCPACEHRLELASDPEDLEGDRDIGAPLACRECDLRFPMPEGMTLAEVRCRADALLRSVPLDEEREPSG